MNRRQLLALATGSGALAVFPADAAPTLPPGSPGMEMGVRQDPYDVFLIDKRGHETVFASHPKA